MTTTEGKPKASGYMFDKTELHQAAVTMMKVTGSFGGKYAVESDGFFAEAEVKRTKEGKCSFCSQEGHDVGKYVAPETGVVYGGNEWNNA